MVHRNRLGRVDDSLVVTVQDVRDALKVNDMSPYWVDKLIAISYHPITNTDARRAFEIGAIDDQELWQRFQDNGYTAKDAEQLVNYAKAERDRTIAAKTGVLSPRVVLAAYRDGMIGSVEADLYLQPIFADAVVRQQQIRYADLQGQIDTRRKAVAVAQKQYAYGEIDGGGFIAAVTAAGVPQDGIQTLTARATAAKNGHLKEPRVDRVLQWFQSGVINLDQTKTRLARLGYADDDIANMLSYIGAQEEAQRASQLARAAAQAAAQIKRNQKEAQANARYLQNQQKGELQIELDKLKLEIQQLKLEEERIKERKMEQSNPNH
jgi:hypothetical protein